MPVVVEGETGTGKEWAARDSLRQRGAFTDARSALQDLIEVAHRGTLFLARGQQAAARRHFAGAARAGTASAHRDRDQGPGHGARRRSPQPAEWPVQLQRLGPGGGVAGRPARIDLRAELHASLELLVKASAHLGARLQLGPLKLALRIDVSAFAQLIVKLCAQLRLRLEVDLGRPNLPELRQCRYLDARNVRGPFPFAALNDRPCWSCLGLATAPRCSRSAARRSTPNGRRRSRRCNRNSYRSREVKRRFA